MGKKGSPKKFDFLRFCAGGLFVFSLVVFLYVSQDVFLPVILSLILMLITKPFYVLLQHCLKIPRAAAAFLIVLGATGLLATGGYFLAEPATKYMEELGDRDVQAKLRKVFSPIQKIHEDIVKAAKKVDEIAEEPAEELESEEDHDSEDDQKKSGEEDPKNGSKVSGPTTDPGINQPEADRDDGPKPKEGQTGAASSDREKAFGKGEKKVGKPSAKEETVSVKIKHDSVGAFYTAVKNFGFYALSTLVLLFFLLAYGEDVSKRMGQARGAPELLLEIEREVSGYLFTITAINIGLGIAIGTTLWLIGIPNPVLWGVMATLLNFIPYTGALIGAAVVTLVAAMEFQTPGLTFDCGSAYLGLSALEGNLITPLLIGRRFEINPIIVFVWVLIWSAIWGSPECSSDFPC